MVTTHDFYCSRNWHNLSFGPQIGNNWFRTNETITFIRSNKLISICILDRKPLSNDNFFEFGSIIPDSLGNEEIKKFNCSHLLIYVNYLCWTKVFLLQKNILYKRLNLIWIRFQRSRIISNSEPTIFFTMFTIFSRPFELSLLIFSTSNKKGFLWISKMHCQFQIKFGK